MGFNSAFKGLNCRVICVEYPLWIVLEVLYLFYYFT